MIMNIVILIVKKMFFVIATVVNPGCCENVARSMKIFTSHLHNRFEIDVNHGSVLSILVS